MLRASNQTEPPAAPHGPPVYMAPKRDARDRAAPGAEDSVGTERGKRLAADHGGSSGSARVPWSPDFVRLLRQYLYAPGPQGAACPSGDALAWLLACTPPGTPTGNWVRACLTSRLSAEPDEPLPGFIAEVPVRVRRCVGSLVVRAYEYHNYTKTNPREGAAAGVPADRVDSYHRGEMTLIPLGQNSRGNYICVLMEYRGPPGTKSPVVQTTGVVDPTKPKPANAGNVSPAGDPAAERFTKRRWVYRWACLRPGQLPPWFVEVQTGPECAVAAKGILGHEVRPGGATLFGASPLLSFDVTCAWSKVRGNPRQCQPKPVLLLRVNNVHAACRGGSVGQLWDTLEARYVGWVLYVMQAFVVHKCTGVLSTTGKSPACRGASVSKKIMLITEASGLLTTWCTNSAVTARGLLMRGRGEVETTMVSRKVGAGFLSALTHWVFGRVLDWNPLALQQPKLVTAACNDPRGVGKQVAAVAREYLLLAKSIYMGRIPREGWAPVEVLPHIDCDTDSPWLYALVYWAPVLDHQRRLTTPTVGALLELERHLITWRGWDAVSSPQQWLRGSTGEAAPSQLLNAPLMVTRAATKLYRKACDVVRRSGTAVLRGKPWTSWPATKEEALRAASRTAEPGLKTIALGKMKLVADKLIVSGPGGAQLRYPTGAEEKLLAQWCTSNLMPVLPPPGTDDQWQAGGGWWADVLGRSDEASAREGADRQRWIDGTTLWGVRMVAHPSSLRLMLQQGIERDDAVPKTEVVVVPACRTWAPFVQDAVGGADTAPGVHVTGTGVDFIRIVEERVAATVVVANTQGAVRSVVVIVAGAGTLPARALLATGQALVNVVVQARTALCQGAVRLCLVLHDSGLPEMQGGPRLPNSGGMQLNPLRKEGGCLLRLSKHRGGPLETCSPPPSTASSASTAVFRSAALHSIFAPVLRPMCGPCGPGEGMVADADAVGCSDIATVSSRRQLGDCNPYSFTLWVPAPGSSSDPPETIQRQLHLAATYLLGGRVEQGRSASEQWSPTDVLQSRALKSEKAAVVRQTAPTTPFFPKEPEEKRHKCRVLAGPRCCAPHLPFTCGSLSVDPRNYRLLRALRTYWASVADKGPETAGLHPAGAITWYKLQAGPLPLPTTATVQILVEVPLPQQRTALWATNVLSALRVGATLQTHDDLPGGEAPVQVRLLHTPEGRLSDIPLPAPEVFWYDLRRLLGCL